MNMFARFDENPAMILQDTKETKRYGRTHARTDGRTDGWTDNVKTVYPPQTKFAGGITTATIPSQNKEDGDGNLVCNLRFKSTIVFSIIWFMCNSETFNLSV